MGWISIFLLPMAEEEGFVWERETESDIYIHSIFGSPVISARSDRHLGVIAISPRISQPSAMPSTSREDEAPPPYTLNPTDDVSLEFGPTRPFRPAPPPPPQPPLSDFARDFYAADERASRSAGNLPHTQNAFPDDRRPTRTPVPGHPLLNNGKTLVYTTGYECYKCRSLPILSPPFADGIQATTPATRPLTPPTRVASAGKSTQSPIRAPSSTRPGTTVHPTDRDLS